MRHRPARKRGMVGKQGQTNGQVIKEIPGRTGPWQSESAIATAHRGGTRDPPENKEDLALASVSADAKNRPSSEPTASALLAALGRVSRR
mmetsp:Transcript_86119/g.155106  ORF Transcript_86119/g.155106 Transcript_86119/m.155106 type:complete len:90 (+) Transcript_86119:232-501(+)